MRKINQAWEKQYNPLKLFKEDIEKIISIITTGLKEINTPEGWENKLDIRTDKFELDNLSELSEIKEKFLRELSILVGDEHIQLKLGRTTAHLRIKDEENTTLMGIGNRIDAILRMRERSFKFLHSFSGRLLVTLSAAFVSGFGYGLKSFSRTPLPILLFATGITISVMIPVYTLYTATHRSTIEMVYSYGKRNFFIRNKDNILVGVIVSIISIILGVFGTLFVQWITKQP